MFREKRALFGQPRGLYVLMMTDLWGRFGFAGMKAILIYYLAQNLLLSQPRASLFFGTYTSLLLITPLPCGVLADRYFGRHTSVLMGAGLMCLGNLMLVFPVLLYPALAMLAFGTGLFQSCLPSQVTGLYKGDDAGATVGFNLYYVALNIGALLGGVFCGAVGEYYGWKWGFALAGLGMLPAIIAFIIGSRHFPEKISRNSQAQVRDNNISKFDRTRISIFLAFIIGIVIFGVSYEQMFNSVAFWIVHDVDRHVESFKIPMTWFGAINPLVVILMGPILGLFWRRRPEDGEGAALCGRVAIGAMIVGGAYAFLALISVLVSGAEVNWIPPLLFMIIMTIGEIFFLPASMSLFGRIAPPQAAAGFFGIWFLSNAAGNFLAGLLSTRWSLMGHDMFFLLAAIIAALAAGLFWSVRRSSLFVVGRASG
jgi:POT family proton-dependent oligopeptide transporter